MPGVFERLPPIGLEPRARYLRPRRCGTGSQVYPTTSLDERRLAPQRKLGCSREFDPPRLHHLLSPTRWALLWFGGRPAVREIGYSSGNWSSAKALEDFRAKRALGRASAHLFRAGVLPQEAAGRGTAPSASKTCQGRGRGFESLRPLQIAASDSIAYGFC